EFLTLIPEAKWLDLVGVKHLITDRTGDNFYQSGADNVFFDLQQRALLADGQSLAIGFLPPYQSTELWIIAEGAAGTVRMQVDGVWVDVQSEIIEGTVGGVPTAERAENIYRAVWPNAVVPEQIELVATGGEWLVAGVSLVNSTAHTFRQIVPGQYRLAHTGDVKIYENLDVLPRAFALFGWQYAGDLEGAVAVLQGLDVYREAVIEGVGEAVTNAGDVGLVSAEISHYAPEQIDLNVQMPQAGLLVLTEAFYPGWEVAVDGVSAEIEKVDGMFRGVFLPAGAHEVRFQFKPRSLQIGLAVTVVGLLAVVGLVVVSRRSGTHATLEAMQELEQGGGQQFNSAETLFASWDK
ncbi:MAG TPA: hypothetical protein ENJ56_06340, partial [Anaerolineae bacterium]|nr:hypothetical protein [Anaerolineae bacterium]